MKYKSSDVEWNFQIPENWDLKRIKHTSKICYGEPLKEENRIDGSYFVFGSNGIVGHHDKCITGGETIIIGRKGSFGKINWSPYPCYPIDTTFYIDATNTSSNLKWLYYILNNLELDSYTKDSSVPGISREEIYERFIYYPPLQEQSQISFFLDQKTTIIDNLIEKKIRKIELLKEQRTSIINRVVTKGLNPKERMKNSGVEWMGEIPTAWVVQKLKYCSDIIYGISPNESSYNDLGEGIELINGPVEYSEEDFGFTRSLKWTTDPKKFASKGSLLFCLRGSTTGRMNITHKDVAIGRGVCAINPRGSFGYTLYCMIMIRSYIQELISGSTFPSVTKDDVDNFQIPYPPITEQNQIVEYLDKKISEIDKQVDLENRKIDLLKEYRQSLISEVVTGKIDVRTN